MASGRMPAAAVSVSGGQGSAARDRRTTGAHVGVAAGAGWQVRRGVDCRCTRGCGGSVKSPGGTCGNSDPGMPKGPFPAVGR